jgi:hypothetical protein
VNDTLIFLVLAGLALIFRWLTSRGSSDEEEPAPPWPDKQGLPPRPPAQTDEERVRRFLEALGVPQGTQPPPPVRTRKVVTPTQPAVRPKVKRGVLQPLPPLVTTPADMPLPPAQIGPSPPPVVVMEPAAPPEIQVPPPLASPLPAMIPRVTQRAQPAPAVTRPVATPSLGALLRSRASVRQAIILREVLGPPRGLQPLAEIQGI